MRNISLVAVAVLASSCTWVKLEGQGQAIRVARTGEALAHCQRAGEITVSVRDRIGLYERNDLKVRDELETLARNEAGSLDADTLQAAAPPDAGEQQFVAWRCGAAKASTAAAAAAPRTDTTERSYPAHGEPAAVQPLPVEAPAASKGFEPIDED